MNKTDTNTEINSSSNIKKEPMSRVQKRLVNSCTAIDIDLPKLITYQHSIFCQVSLPYRNPGDNVKIWHRKQGKACLSIYAGCLLNQTTNKLIQYGLPFGTKARLILLFLNCEALKTQSPIIELNKSLTSFACSFGINSNGRDITKFKEQFCRLAASEYNLFFLGASKTLQTNTKIIQTTDLEIFIKKGKKIYSWPSTIELPKIYFESLMAHAVPLDQRAILALSHTAMGLDIYIWLAQRLHRIQFNKPQFLTWVAIKSQFGWNYARMNDFKNAFTKTLRIVHLQYLTAIISFDEKGITLSHSPPPVPSKLVRICINANLKTE